MKKNPKKKHNKSHKQKLIPQIGSIQDDQKIGSQVSSDLLGGVKTGPKDRSGKV